MHFSLINIFKTKFREIFTFIELLHFEVPVYDSWKLMYVSKGIYIFIYRRFKT